MGSTVVDMATAFDDLRALHDRGALYAALTQLALQDGVQERLGGEFDYAADLVSDSFVFTGKSTGATIETSVELMASVAPGPQSMLCSEDHRAAVHGLAEMSGWVIDWTADWGRAELSDPVTGNSVTAEFDGYARLTALRGTLGGHQVSG